MQGNEKWAARQVQWEALEFKLFEQYGHRECMDYKKHPLENILALLSELDYENTQLRGRLSSGVLQVQISEVLNHGKKQQGMGEVAGLKPEQGGERLKAAGQAGASGKPIIKPTQAGGTWHFIWDLFTAWIFTR